MQKTSGPFARRSAYSTRSRSAGTPAARPPGAAPLTNRRRSLGGLTIADVLTSPTPSPAHGLAGVVYIGGPIPTRAFHAQFMTPFLAEALGPLLTESADVYTRAFPTEMDLTYKRRFTDAKIPEAYEALILDALRGDHSNFVRDDELDVAWKVSSSCLTRGAYN